jgi:hypothetical protein
LLASVPRTPYNGRIAVAPDGTLILAYVQYQLSGSPSVVVRRSVDGGATFEESRLVSSVAADYHAVSNLEVGVSPLSGTVLLAWDNVGSGGLHQILLARSSDGGLSFSTPGVLSSASMDARNTALTAGAGGRVHLLWQQAASVGGASSVVYARSSDDGLSFSGPSLVDSGDHPWVAEGPNATVAVAWGQGGEILVERSSDGGVSFGTAQNLSGSSGASLTPRAVYGADGTLYVAWAEDAVGILLRRTSAGAAPAPGGPASPASLGLSVAVNQSRFAPRQTLVVSASVENHGLSPAVDFYLGVLLPDGATVVSFTSGGPTVGQLPNVATLVPLTVGVSLAQAFAVTVPDIIKHTWTGAEPSGTYVLFLAAVKPGAFADGSVDPGDVLALSLATFSFGP